MAAGTGSGSLFALLTKYKKQVHRYTIGVGILPERQNVEEFSNAGRYLTKYIGTPGTNRFHTLLLFSNEAAANVLTATATRDDRPLRIINAYIARFIHDFSLINDNKTDTQFGKLFDPMDGKRYLTGICTVGFSSGPDFDAKEFFIRAISPMSYDKKGLRGLAVRITRAQHDTTENRQISELVARIVDALEHGQPIADDVHQLRAMTPFYRTIKQVRIFYFIKNVDYQNAAYNLKATMERFFQYVSGDKVSVSTNCYYTPESESRDNSLLVLFRGAFTFEIYESVMQYAQQSFIKSGDVEPDFGDAFNGMLEKVKHQEQSVVGGGLHAEIENVLRDTNCNLVETTGVETTEITKHPEVRSILTMEKLNGILLKREALKATLVEVARSFSLGDTRVRPKGDVFDTFDNDRRTAEQASGPIARPDKPAARSSRSQRAQASKTGKKTDGEEKGFNGGQRAEQTH